MQLPSIQSETTLSQRRGKIARLPRAIREQLNCRLDDGLEASEILPWLNDLPEVRQIVIQRFNGVPISPQNLSAWRQGGFQEWLLQRELFDSASHMCEHVQELQEIIGSDSPDDVPHTLADYMVTQLSVRFAAFLGRWDGNPSNEQIGQLLKIGQFLVKLERATVQAKREAFERRQAEREHQSKIELAAAYKEYCAEQLAAKNTVQRKPYVRTKRTSAQSSPVKVPKGSCADQGSPQKSTESAIIQQVELTKSNRQENGTLISPLESQPNSTQAIRLADETQKL